MTGITPNVMFAVNRILVTFVDHIGNPLSISGTGFWIFDESRNYILVTNKHNCDPKIKLGSDTNYKLHQVVLELRCQVFNKLFPETKFFQITDLSCLKFHPSADVCIFKSPQFVNHDSDCHMYTPFNLQKGESSCNPLIKVADIADSLYLEEKVDPMDSASFIGFPGSGGNVWWDEKWNLPIARQAIIASHPKIPFTNKAVPTTDIMLVSGLSFSGSSGSPVFLHSKGFPSSSTIKFSYYVESKIIGIMSGHFEDKDAPPMFQHTGLSYFTRSTAILELLQEN